MNCSSDLGPILQSPVRRGSVLAESSGIGYRRTAEDSCSVCFSDNDKDCITLDTVTCEFYTETSKILASDMPMMSCLKDFENPQLCAQVDSAIFSVMETGLSDALSFTISEECIPFISTYTDCNKENICMGCKTCKCDVFGHWNCGLGRRCKPDQIPSIVDHDTLARVIETIKKGDSYELRKNRVKRWTFKKEALAAKEAYKRDLIQTPTVSREETVKVDSNKTSTRNLEETVMEYSNETEYADVQSHRNMTTKITFAELSDWLNDAHKAKNMLNNGEEITPPAMIKGKEAPEIVETDRVMHIAHVLSASNTSDKVSVLKVSKDNLNPGTSDSIVDFPAVNEPDKKDSENWELNNKIANSDPTPATVNIMKREIYTPDDQAKFNKQSELDSVLPKNITSTTINKFDRLKSDVLDPIDNILKDKQKEIQELLRIKEGLINFTNSHREVMNETSPDTMFSILKIDVPHKHHHVKTRMGNSNNTLLKNFFVKLKKDVYEVIQDIINIRKLFADNKQLPPEIKHLTQAMNHYIRKTDSLIKRRSNVIPDSRRGFELTVSNPSSNSVKSKVLDVLKILDKYKPLACALRTLSPHIQRVIKRIIKQNNVDDLTAAAGSSISNANYNFIGELKSIGARWELISTQIKESPVHEKLHNMKRLYITVALDTAKLKDALAMFELFSDKRIIVVKEKGSVKIVLNNINKNIQELSSLVNTVIDKNKSTHLETNIQNNNVSFLSRMKNMLKNSKKDIMRLFKKKSNKKKIKETALKNLEELTKKRLQETMQRWQRNLNISNVRKKRSANKYLICKR